MTNTKQRTYIILIVSIAALLLLLFAFFLSTEKNLVRKFGSKKNKDETKLKEITDPQKFSLPNPSSVTTSNNNLNRERIQETANKNSLQKNIVIDTTNLSGLKTQNLYTKPIAGITSFFSKNNTKAKILTYRIVDRETGNIFDLTGPEFKPINVSSKNIPAIQEAVWITPNKTLLRYLSPDNKTINTYLLNISSQKKSSGNFLKKNIQQVAPAPDKSGKFYYQINTPRRKSAQHFIASQHNNPSLITTTDFTEWIPQWVNPKKIFFTTKASRGIKGYLYSLDITTGQMTLVLENIPGLTTLASHNGNQILYSQSKNTLSLFIYDTKTKTSTAIETPTLPEKCVWTKDDSLIFCFTPEKIPPAPYPDIWYQGLLSFNDTLVIINPENGQATPIYNMRKYTKKEFDGVSISLSPDEKYIIVINRNTYLPWVIDIGSYTQKTFNSV